MTEYKDEMKRIMVTGSVGQIGSELTLALRKRYGSDNVVALGRKTAPSEELKNSGPFEYCDVTEQEKLEGLVKEYEIDTVYHMAAILSATGEANPGLAWWVNMEGTKNVLDLGVKYGMARLVMPSSIAAFGPSTPQHNTPQETILKPRTMYGVTKVAGELLCDYYFHKYGLDIRGLRYPGIISAETLPGGGTTDYAVEIFYEAIKERKYTSFLGPESTLPMMYMPDCLKATIDLADADVSKLRMHSDYNVTAFSINPAQLADAIRVEMPEFEISYAPDHRQAIADSWPRSIDDTYAREDWGWKPDYDLAAMTRDMLERLTKKLT